MNNYNYRPNDDRLIFPFLTGALVGGAAVGLTRPMLRHIQDTGQVMGHDHLILDLILIILTVVIFQCLMDINLTHLMS